MDINNKIKELKGDLPLPCFYIKRQKDIEECIVYTYIEVPNLVGDCRELGTKYTVLFNVYSKQHNVEKTKKEVKLTLEKHGFIKKMIPGTVVLENGLFNTAMQYIISLKNDFKQ